MSLKFNESQTALLRAASARDDRYLTPPLGAKLTLARKAVAKLLEAGLVREVKAKRNAPIWRHDDDAECDFSLKLTAAGLTAAIANATANDGSVKPLAQISDPAQTTDVASTPLDLAANKTSQRDALTAISGDIISPRAGTISPRAGTKIASAIEMLSRANGATIEELVAAMGWLPHTTRAALTGLRKRGYELASERSDRARGLTYRIVAASKSVSASEPSIGQDASEGMIVAGAQARPNPTPASRKRRRLATTSANTAQSHEAP